MVNLDTHKIVDIIDSRETKQVEEWLKTFPNLTVISRDGAQTYRSAARNAHPDAIQISDRFHLLKNLSDAVEKYMYRLFPSRLVIPATIKNPEMQALYDTRNRAERIMFAHKKHDEGYSITDIALLLHSSISTVKKYLAISKDEIVFCKPFLDKVAKHFWTLLHVQIGQSCNAWSTLLSRLTVALQTLFNYYSTRYGNGSSVSVSSCACSLK
ncbi:MAG: transposase [Anaerostipes sp.]|uniref:transposase n=1 Tax=Anaerostipes sp. TaxID=1872530 RepID=UPI003994B775